MEVWTAEDSAGNIHVVSAPEASPATFAGRVIQYLEDISEPGSPTELSLYRWPDERTAGVWLKGDEVHPGTSWTEMARQATVGWVAYVWPGRFVFLEPGQELPRPPAGLRPVTEEDLDAYERGDPKRVELSRSIDRGGF